jgi:carbamoyl-phosphate synthase large subunit
LHPPPKRMCVALSSAGRRVALAHAFTDAMAKAGIAEPHLVALDASPLAPAWHAADERYIVPPCSSDEFVDAVMEICRRTAVDLLVPTIDPELPVYAAHQPVFEAAGTRICCSSTATVSIGADKQTTHDWLVAHGFPTVAQRTLAEAQASADGLDYPVIVKPSRGSGSLGVRLAGGPSDLCGIHEQARPQGRAGDAGESGYIVQSIAPGAEFTVDVFVSHAGDCVCTVPRRRLEVRSGEVSKAVTVRHDALQQLVSSIVSSLPAPRGPLNVQVFVDDATDEMRVIEINPRFGGGYPLSRAAGADFPAWLVDESLGRPVPRFWDRWRPGLVMLRYDEAVFVDGAEVGLS